MRIPTLTCPYCRTVFVGRVVRHGLINCGHCRRSFRI